MFHNGTAVRPLLLAQKKLSRYLCNDSREAIDYLEQSLTKFAVPCWCYFVVVCCSLCHLLFDILYNIQLPALAGALQTSAIQTTNATHTFAIKQ